MSIKIGKKYNFHLKPSMLKGWIVIRETAKCYVIRKTYEQRYGKKNFVGDCIYLPKKDVNKIEVSE